jgi:hypothetical protein
MLLALNFILLSFFIMLVSMASGHKGRKDLALAAMAAQFDQPHDEVTSQPEGTFLPHAGASAWQPQLSVQLLGMVPNLLPVPTPEVEADANDLIVKLPLKALFEEGKLTDAAQKALPNLLQLGSVAHAHAEVWLGLDNTSSELATQRLQALAAVVAEAPLGLYLGGELKIVYRPDGTTADNANLGRLPGAAGAAGGEVHGRQ